MIILQLLTYAWLLAWIGFELIRIFVALEEHPIEFLEIIQ